MKPLTVDAHVDALWVLSGHALQQSPPTVNKLRMQFGGLDRVVLALYLSDDVQDRLRDEQSWRAIQLQITAAKMNFPDQYLALEGARCLGNTEVTMALRLKQLKDVGVKYVTLVHNFNNIYAGSATDVRMNELGLTKMGRDLVEELDFHDILVDVSHANDRTIAEVLSYAGNRPIIASHSGCRALLGHRRNLTDTQITQIAATGGIVCVPFAKKFVGTSAGVGQHIDHIISLTGSVEHVGIGSDLDGARMVDGVNGAEDWSRVVLEELSYRGIKDEDIMKVAGGNLLRLFEGYRSWAREA